MENYIFTLLNLSDGKFSFIRSQHSLEKWGITGEVIMRTSTRVSKKA